MQNKSHETSSTDGNISTNCETSSTKLKRKCSDPTIKTIEETTAKAPKTRSEQDSSTSSENIYTFRFLQGQDTTDWKQATELVWQTNYSEWPQKSYRYPEFFVPTQMKAEPDALATVDDVMMKSISQTAIEDRAGPGSLRTEKHAASERSKITQ